MQKRIVLIGAGSTNFGLGTIGDIFKSKVLAGSKIVLHDINAEALKKSETIAKNYKDKLNLNVKKYILTHSQNYNRRSNKISRELKVLNS